MSKQLLYCGPPFKTLHEDYAKRGRLDEEAPIQAFAQLYIDAPLESVWDSLINLPLWPVIDPSVRDDYA